MKEPDRERLNAAYVQAREDLLAQRTAAGHWIGELSTSALSTATAISALAVASRDQPHAPAAAGDRELIARGLAWLLAHQNPDGGWGDTDRSYSNIATTMLAIAALELAQRGEGHGERLAAAEAYVTRQGGVTGLRRRYGRDKTFAVPILTNAALAGRVAWREVAALPFELACFPQSFYRFLQLPVVSYAIPALVAIGQAKFHHDPPRNPLWRAVRRAAVAPSLRVLRRMQPASGGYLEAIPLTSFVVMSLAACGRAGDPVAEHGLRFIRDSVRPEGSWPIDTNLATWGTTLALGALAGAGEEIVSPGVLDWLLNCQCRVRHPFTGARPGGWGWSDLSGAVPDADDTPGALLALAAWYRSAACSPADRARIAAAAEAGCDWLLALQNRDGGWPTFCHGWGKLPFDRSGADLTAHALRALHAWHALTYEGPRGASASGTAFWRRRWPKARRRGLRYLQRVQQPDGAWVPLWFGNQDHPREENPVYGTAKVLLAYVELQESARPEARRGSAWLQGAQGADGGWNSGAAANGPRDGTVEETALALESLLHFAPAGGRAVAQGLDWLIRAVETKRHLEPAPIGFYFAKLWYYERLYPVIFTVSALGQARRRGVQFGTMPALTRLA